MGREQELGKHGTRGGWSQLLKGKWVLSADLSIYVSVAIYLYGFPSVDGQSAFTGSCYIEHT